MEIILDTLCSSQASQNTSAVVESESRSSSGASYVAPDTTASATRPKASQETLRAQSLLRHIFHEIIGYARYESREWA